MMITFARECTLTLVGWDEETDTEAEPQGLHFLPGDTLEVDADERFIENGRWFVAPLESGGMIQLPKWGWTATLRSDELKEQVFPEY